MISDIFSRNEIVLGPLRQIPPGEGRNFEVNGQRIAVFHTRAGEVFAIQAECPHRAGSLSDGLLGGTMLVCPLHAWKFDLRTGQALYGDRNLATVHVRLTRDGDIVLALGPDGEPR
jgi:nitrite reductase (NADH) small subunit